MIPRPKIVIPKSAKTGDIIEIKTLITHQNNPEKQLTGEQDQSGQDTESKNEPDRYIRDFTVAFEDTQVFHARLTPKISANPYISFYLKAEKSGDLIFTWQENTGRSWTTKHHIKVS